MLSAKTRLVLSQISGEKSGLAEREMLGISQVFATVEFYCFSFQQKEEERI